MKSRIIACLLCCLFCIGFKISAQNGANHEPNAGTASADDFNPERDPVGARQANGTFMLTESELVLARSLKTAVSFIAQVKSVTKKTIRDVEHLYFKCTLVDEPEYVEAVIAIPLTKNEAGQYFASNSLIGCLGTDQNCPVCDMNSSGSCPCPGALDENGNPKIIYCRPLTAQGKVLAVVSRK